MATVTPAITIINIRGMSVPRLAWSSIVTGDTIESYGITAQAGVAGAVQFSGTFGGATIALQGSNDGTTFYTLEDLQGTAISGTAAGYFEFTTAALYLRPSISGGSGNAVNVIAMLRG
jgi:hypothetical protein